MGNKVVAIVGSYRKNGTIDSAVSAILEGARQRGAAVSKIYLLDRHIEFCTNCRACTQESGPRRGKCVQQDDLESVLSEIEAADALVLGAPVNFWNVNALFRRFLERLVGSAYWPWDISQGPELRDKTVTKKAALVTSAAMPGWMIPIGTGAPRALKVAAKLLGAKPVAKLWLGFSAMHPVQPLSASAQEKASRIGRRLA